MEGCTLALGGLRLRLEGATAVVARAASRWDAFRVGDGAADLRLAFVDEAAGRDGVTRDDFFFDRLDLRLGADAERATMRAWFNGSEGALDATLGLALQIALLPRGGLLVHAAAGVLDGVAWLMPGESGRGKSTAAAHAGFERVLSDELVIVRRHGAGFAAWGTPFWSRGRSLPMDSGSAPLAVVARLHQADAVHAAEARQDALAMHLISSVVLYERQPASRARAFDLACDVVAGVTTLDLWFPKEGPWIRRAARWRAS